MGKLEALQYICNNAHCAQGGYQMSHLVQIILEEKELYSKDELDLIIKDMEDY